MAVVCYSPLGRGLLASAFTTKESVSGTGDYRAAYFPRFAEENFEANMRIVDQFKALADKKGCTVSQMALAWLLKQGNDIFPIPGTKRMSVFGENWSSLDVNLTEKEEVEVREFVESVEVAGYRSVELGKAYASADTKEERDMRFSKQKI